jgi:hypothetical protein
MPYSSRGTQLKTESGLSDEELKKLADPGITIEDWHNLIEDARMLIRLGEQNLWAKADLAQEAASRYGRLKELCEELHQSYGYWRILSHVAAQYSKEEREQFLDLSFGHYSAVVGKENRMDLLRRAAEEGWSVGELLKQANPTVENRVDGIIMPPPQAPENAGEIFEEENEPNVSVNVSAGRNIADVVELLNMIAELDHDVALGIGTGSRPCSDELDKWLAEALDYHTSGIGVLDVLNLLFLDQGIIVMGEGARPFMLEAKD